MTWTKAAREFYLSRPKAGILLETLQAGMAIICAAFPPIERLIGLFLCKKLREYGK